MSTLMLTGNHLRHYFVANALAEAGQLAALVMEKREAFVPEPPDDIDDDLKALFIRHFREREEVEQEFFGGANREFPGVPTLRVSREELNGPRVREFATEIGAELALSYGVHFLKKATLAVFPEIRWNVHGGLSPRYRGCITMFWPSYMLEPQMTGITVHQLTQKLDGGPIVHQCAAPLVRGDGLHQLAGRAVMKLAGELPRLVKGQLTEELAPPQKQKSAGKLWLERDWRPEHLRLIYDVYGNRIVDCYLDGKFKQTEPDLIRQF
ncbi:MAG: methionyl-tRNA formyltransferase [bacterium]|nr:methionyl-tRNA formyltransferase [bacterium]